MAINLNPKRTPASKEKEGKEEKLKKITNLWLKGMAEQLHSDYIVNQISIYCVKIRCMNHRHYTRTEENNGGKRIRKTLVKQ